MATSNTALNKELAFHDVPWEDAYGYAQAVKVGRSIFVSGQLSHDAAGAIVGPAALDASGRPLDFSMMALQMETTYANAQKLLATFGATLDHVVEETLCVLDAEIIPVQPLGHQGPMPHSCRAGIRPSHDAPSAQFFPRADNAMVEEPPPRTHF